MSLNDTPRANRLHIGLFGKRNSGKSSLVNALTGHEVALVSDVAGTTADPVYKSMELHGIGPVVFIDTAGFDDEGSLGTMRVEKTRQALEKTDIALLLFSDEHDMIQEMQWFGLLKEQKIPVVAVINKADIRKDVSAFAGIIEQETGLRPVIASAKNNEGTEQIRDAMIRLLPEGYERTEIAGHLVSPGDTVLLVMPQDIQAPKGRLILPQVQTLRDLLDNKCLVLSCTADGYEAALAVLKVPPALIIVDSQVFPLVYAKKPPESRLTSFSVLFAGQKGDIHAFIDGAEAIDRLTKHSKVLIAEACTHAPLTEDIGRVKIPQMLRKKVGEQLTVDIVSGTDFPDDLSRYDLVIHCGGCMFNRQHVLSRLRKAQKQGVPMTNYGVVLAKLGGILDKITY